MTTRPPVSYYQLLAGYYTDWWLGQNDALRYQGHTDAQVEAFRARAISRQYAPGKPHTHYAYNDGLVYGLDEIMRLRRLQGAQG